MIIKYTKQQFIYGIIFLLCYYQLTLILINLSKLTPTFQNNIGQLSLLSLSYIVSFLILYFPIKQVLRAKINSFTKYSILVLIFIMLNVITIFTQMISTISFFSKLNNQEIATYRGNELAVKIVFTIIWLFIFGYIIFKEEKHKKNRDEKNI